MTFEDIENQLPNGTHDAILTGFAVDLVSNTLKLESEADMAAPDTELLPDEPDMRPVRITVSGLSYFAFDPPQGDWRGGHTDLAISEELSKENDFLPADAVKRLPPGSFCQRLYTANWISWITFAGTEAKLEWLDEAQLRTGN